MTITEAPRPATAPRHLPVQIAPDTFVVQNTQGEGVAPVAVHLNSMVIRGTEPIVVDTGVAENRDRWFEDVCSIVDLDDVRWVFLSHDDADHYGNLVEVMDRCPNATLLTSWFQWERMGTLPTIPPFRMRWLEAGDTFTANGRTYATVRPPVYDSPTTRGLFDTATGVYWASDCFASPVPHGMADIAELDREQWQGGFAMFHQFLAPWMSMIDERRFQDEVTRVANLGIATIASAHSPSISGANVATAIDLLRAVPSAPVTAAPGQAELDAIVASILGAGRS